MARHETTPTATTTTTTERSHSSNKSATATSMVKIDNLRHDIFKWWIVYLTALKLWKLIPCIFFVVTCKLYLHIRNWSNVIGPHREPIRNREEDHERLSLVSIQSSSHLTSLRASRTIPTLYLKYVYIRSIAPSLVARVKRDWKSFTCTKYTLMEFKSKDFLSTCQSATDGDTRKLVNWNRRKRKNITTNSINDSIHHHATTPHDSSLEGQRTSSSSIDPFRNHKSVDSLVQTHTNHNMDGSSEHTQDRPLERSPQERYVRVSLEVNVLSILVLWLFTWGYLIIMYCSLMKD